MTISINSLPFSEWNISILFINETEAEAIFDFISEVHKFRTMISSTGIRDIWESTACFLKFLNYLRMASKTVPYHYNLTLKITIDSKFMHFLD